MNDYEELAVLLFTVGTLRSVCGPYLIVVALVFLILKKTKKKSFVVDGSFIFIFFKFLNLMIGYFYSY